jgi:magnesium-transporting ATPase (P-type)
VLFRVTLALMIVAIFASTVIFISLLYRQVPVLSAIGICVVLLVASIPIAMQVRPRTFL